MIYCLSEKYVLIYRRVTLWLAKRKNLMNRYLLLRPAEETSVGVMVRIIMEKERKMGYQEAYEKLEEYGQLHVLKYYEELSGYEKEELLSQIGNTDC